MYYCVIYVQNTKFDLLKNFVLLMPKNKLQQRSHFKESIWIYVRPIVTYVCHIDCRNLKIMLAL